MPGNYPPYLQKPFQRIIGVLQEEKFFLSFILILYLNFVVYGSLVRYHFVLEMLKTISTMNKVQSYQNRFWHMLIQYLSLPEQIM